MRRLLLPFIAIPSLLSAQVTRNTHGDTTFILTRGNGTWGTPHLAMEVRRIGGGTSREATFGEPTSITALPNGGVVLLDRKALDGPIIRMFDADGRFVRNIGRIGSGPGEYRDFGDIKVSADGRIWVADIANARVSIYGADGKYLTQFRIPGDSWSVDMLRLGQHGDLYLMSPFFPAGGNFQLRYNTHLHMDTTGRVLDTIRPGPALGGGPEPAMSTSVLADGRLVSIAHDRIGFLISNAPGQRGMVVSELGLSRVAYTSAERRRRDSVSRQTQAARGRIMNATIQPAPPLPEFKPSFNRTIVDFESRIWLQRSLPDTGILAKTPNRNRLPIAYDGFRPDGGFLGEVLFPEGIYQSQLSFLGNFAWGVVMGEDDDIYLVKYRIR